jgi:hypothetical protein
LAKLPDLAKKQMTLWPKDQKQECFSPKDATITLL